MNNSNNYNLNDHYDHTSSLESNLDLNLENEDIDSQEPEKEILEDSDSSEPPNSHSNSQSEASNSQDSNSQNSSTKPKRKLALIDDGNADLTDNTDIHEMDAIGSFNELENSPEFQTILSGINSGDETSSR